MSESENPNPIRLVVCELLCYAVEYIKCTTRDALTKTIDQFYDLDEIIGAKRILYSRYIKKLGEFPPRKTSPNRSEKSAHLEDIMTSLLALDQEEIELKFAAVDIRRLPKWDPNEFDAIGMLEKILTLERRLNNLEMTTSENKVQLLEAKDKVDSLSKRIDNKTIMTNDQNNSNKPESYAMITEKRCQTPTGSAYIPKTEARSDADSKTPNAAPSPLAAIGTGHPTIQQIPNNKHISSVPARLQIPVADSDDGATDVSEGYEFSRYERKRKVRQQKRRNFIAGAATNTRLLGAPPPSRDFFVYRVVKSANEGDIGTHLASFEIQARSVVKLSHEDSTYSSYKVSVSQDDADKIMDPDKWPNGIRIRRFRKFTTNVTDGEA